MVIGVHMKNNNNPKPIDKNSKNGKHNGKQNGKNGKNSSQGNPKYQGKNYNDFSWYDKNHQLVVDTANLPFNLQMSKVLDILEPNIGKGIPMMMTLAHDWLIGAGDAVTTAGRMLWADIRKHNSGATNYQSSDPIAIITAAADVFINIKWMSTFFGIVKYFNARNKRVPEVLFRSAGIDYDDFVKNLADYRARFNKLLLQARVITIPKKYPWIDAAMALYSNLFKDEDSDTGREQLYLVNKAAFYKLATEGEDGHYVVTPIEYRDLFPDDEFIGIRGSASSWAKAEKAYITGSAQATSTFHSLTKFSMFLDILKLQIDAIIQDEDANIIQGDMDKAFSNGSEYKTGQLDESFEIKPIYSEEFGWYLHNATIYGSPSVGVGKWESTTQGEFRAYAIGYIGQGANQVSGYFKEISQDVLRNKIVINYEYSQMRYVLTHESAKGIKFLIDTNKYSPDPSDVIWNSRAINKWYGTDKPIFSNGILLNATIWRVQEMIGTDDTIEAIPVQTVVRAGSMTTGLFEQSPLFTAFKWYPLCYPILKNGSNYYMDIIGERNNMHICEDSELEGINDIVLYSLFDIPQK